MNRYVLLSFAVMGLGFYELSGGADFDPEAARLAMIEARQDRDAERIAARPEQIALATAEIAAPAAEGDAPEVTRAALNLVSFEAVTAPKPVAPAAQADVASAPQIPLQELAAQEELSLASLADTTEPDQSIAFVGTRSVASSAGVGGQQDIRRIKGSLVNMRSGPGTDYPVVDQLTQSTEVEILTDSGNGWVELRPLSGGTTGWIAEFLLSGG